MKKTLKRISLFLVVLSMMLSLLPAGAAMAEEPVTLTVMRGEHASQAWLADTPVILALEEKCNVNIEQLIIPAADFDTKKATLLATNDLPDILYVTMNDLNTYARSGMFVCLDDYADQIPNYLAALSEYELANYYKVDGKSYAFQVLPYAVLPNALHPLINQGELKEHGLEIPDSFEELMTVLKALKDAHPDSIPWTCRNNNILKNVGYPFGVGGPGIYYEPEVDAYRFGSSYPEFADLLAYFADAYAYGVLDPDYTTCTSAQWQENLASGKSFFYMDNGSFATNANKVLTAQDPESYFVGYTTMANSYGQRRNVYYARGWDNHWVIKSDCENIDAALRLMDYMYSEEGRLLTNYGIEGEHYTMVDGEPVENEELVARHIANDSDPWRGQQSELGTGLLSFAGYIDQTTQYPFLDAQTVANYELWGADENISKLYPLPPLTEEEAEEANEILNTLNNIIDVELDKFIMGLRPLEEYPQLIKQLEDNDVRRLEEIYNIAFDRIR